MGTNLIDIQLTHRSLVYQSRLRIDAAAIIRRGGGAARLERCGTIMTEGFQVPQVAWYLGVHTDRLEGPPTEAEPPGPAPNVVLQAAPHTHWTPLPLLSTWPGTHYSYVAGTRTFRLFEHCAS